MVGDILDTSFEGKDVKIDENLIKEGEDINLFEKDPTLRSVILGAGWDIHTFGTDTIDVDISLFLLDKRQKTRIDEDFIFYNQSKALDGGIIHHGDSRTGAGDGDDESITIDFRTVPFDVIHIPVVMSIYKGFEKEQALESVRNVYMRLLNAETRHEILRFDLRDLLRERKETAVILGMINREGPKWHFKADVEFIKGGLAEIAREYGLIINQE